MIDTNSKIGFWQFPIALKFVVIWTCVLGLLDVWELINDTITDSFITINPLVAAIVYFSLTNGLVNKRNSSRIWASVFVGIGTVARFVILILLIFVPEFGWRFMYHSVVYYIPEINLIILMALNILFNTINLYILLRPSTKALFMRQPPQPAPISEPSILDHSAQA